jgi:hypothetical protein
MPSAMGSIQTNLTRFGMRDRPLSPEAGGPGYGSFKKLHLRDKSSFDAAHWNSIGRFLRKGQRVGICIVICIGCPPWKGCGVISKFSIRGCQA